MNNCCSGLQNLTREQVMNLALAVGKLLLKNGAETSRVEDSMTRLCYHFGIYDLNVFVTPTVIIFGDETHSCFDGRTIERTRGFAHVRKECGGRARVAWEIRGDPG